jgi:hypothetical protein
MKLDAAKELVALAHVVVDAGVDVVMRDGRVLAFSRDDHGRPTHTPCALRVALVASLDAPGELLDDVTEMRLTGSLRDAGGGLYRRTSEDGTGSWCFVTSMAPTAIAELIDHGDLDLDLADDSMNARISGDQQLQVSVVSISANVATHEDRAQQVAQWCFASCLVEELTTPAALSWQVTATNAGAAAQRFS